MRGRHSIGMQRNHRRETISNCQNGSDNVAVYLPSARLVSIPQQRTATAGLSASFSENRKSVGRDSRTLFVFRGQRHPFWAENPPWTTEPASCFSLFCSSFGIPYHRSPRQKTNNRQTLVTIHPHSTMENESVTFPSVLQSLLYL